MKQYLIKMSSEEEKSVNEYGQKKELREGDKRRLKSKVVEKKNTSVSSAETTSAEERRKRLMLSSLNSLKCIFK